MYLKLTFHKWCLNQKYSEIGSLRPIFKSPLKSSSYLHIKQDGCETSGFLFWENDRRPEFWLILGPNVAQKIGSLRPKLSTHLKVLSLSMCSNTDVKPLKTFWENNQRPEFLLILGPPQMAPKYGRWCSYSTQCCKNLQWSCEAILMWKQWKLVEKVTQVQNFDLLWGPKWPKKCTLEARIVHISKSSVASVSV